MSKTLNPLARPSTVGELRSSLVQGGMWLTFSRVTVNVLGVISTFALARLLLPHDFGVVANAWTILALLSSVIDMPVGLALIHIRKPTPEHIDTAWTLGLLRGLLIIIALCLVASPAASFFAEPALREIILVLGLGVLLSCLASPTRSLAQRGLSFRLELIIEIGAKFSTVFASIAIAWFYRSYWALVWGAVAGQAATLIIGYVMAPYRPRFCLTRTKDLWSFSAWLTLSQCMATVNWRFDQIMIARLLGPVELGIYSVGDNLAQIPTRETTQPLLKVLFPGFSALRNGPSQLRAGYQRAQGMLTTLVLPLGAGLALIAEPAIRLGMGDKWLPATFVVQMLAAIYSLQTLGSLAQPLALSQGTTRTIFARDLQQFAFRLPLIMSGLILGGLKGVVIARVATGFIAVFLNMRVVHSVIGLPILEQIKASARPIISAAVMVLTVLSVRTLWLQSGSSMDLCIDIALSTAAGAMAYLASLTILWSCNRSPNGPEREILQMICTAVRRYRPIRAIRNGET